MVKFQLQAIIIYSDYKHDKITKPKNVGEGSGGKDMKKDEKVYNNIHLVWNKNTNSVMFFVGGTECQNEADKGEQPKMWVQQGNTNLMTQMKGQGYAPPG